MAADGSEPREVTRIHHWKHGHDPQDDDAVEGSPWNYVRIAGDNMTEDQRKANPYVRAHGPDSGIRCFFCAGPNMRVVDERSAEEIIKGLPGYEEMRLKGRIAEVGNVLMLLCPRCEKTAQVREDVVRRALARAATRTERTE